jgi:hypothetical protein
VGGLEGEVQSLETVLVTVEGYLEILNQEPPNERRSLPREQLRGGPAARPRSDDILCEQLRRVVGAGVDDAALCVAGVRLLRVGELGEEGDFGTPPRRRERRGAPGDAASDNHHVYHS